MLLACCVDSFSWCGLIYRTPDPLSPRTCNFPCSSPTALVSTSLGWVVLSVWFLTDTVSSANIWFYLLFMNFCFLDESNLWSSSYCMSGIVLGFVHINYHMKEILGTFYGWGNWRPDLSKAQWKLYIIIYSYKSTKVVLWSLSLIWPSLLYGFTRKLWLQGVDTCENLGRESSLHFQSEGEWGRVTLR